MLRHNQKVWVSMPDGTRRPAQTVTLALHKRMGYSEHTMPVWYVRAHGFSGWEHAVTIFTENLQVRE